MVGLLGLWTSPCSPLDLNLSPGAARAPAAGGEGDGLDVEDDPVLLLPGPEVGLLLYLPGEGEGWAVERRRAAGGCLGPPGDGGEPADGGVSAGAAAARRRLLVLVGGYIAVLAGAAAGGNRARGP